MQTKSPDDVQGINKVLVQPDDANSLVAEYKYRK
jgi:hypothetical protein